MTRDVELSTVNVNVNANKLSQWSIELENGRLRHFIISIFERSGVVGRWKLSFGGESDVQKSCYRGALKFRMHRHLISNCEKFRQYFRFNSSIVQLYNESYKRLDLTSKPYNRSIKIWSFSMVQITFAFKIIYLATKNVLQLFVIMEMAASLCDILLTFNTL